MNPDELVETEVIETVTVEASRLPSWLVLAFLVGLVWLTSRRRR
jgi:MYXO-CTERM domain-containing protein